MFRFKEYRFKYYDFRLILFITALSILGVMVIGSAGADNDDKKTIHLLFSWIGDYGIFIYRGLSFYFKIFLAYVYF